MGTVTVNAPKTPVTKGSSGVAAATLPNICKMPGPPAPFVPTPLPNIGNSGDSPKGYSKKVKIEGEPVAITGASFGSQGDIASKTTGGGLISSNTHGPTKFIGPGSFNVQIEGKNVQLLGDPMLNNCGPSGSPPNAATMTGVIQAPGVMAVIYGDDQPCGRCGKTHPLEAGPETLEMMGKLYKEIQGEFEAQKKRIKELRQIRDAVHAKRRESVPLKKLHRRGLATADQKRSLLRLEGEIDSLNQRTLLSEQWFEENALLRWDGANKTYSRGYMVGVLSCVCRDSSGRLAACSGEAPPAFIRAIGRAGCACASPPLGTDKGDQGPVRSCAAKQLVSNVGSHRPIQMIERWFAPIVGGLNATRNPTITFDVLIEDRSTKALRFERRTRTFKSGRDVPSCHQCQKELPAIYCTSVCGGKK